MDQELFFLKGLGGYRLPTCTVLLQRNNFGLERDSRWRMKSVSNLEIKIAKEKSTNISELKMTEIAFYFKAFLTPFSNFFARKSTGHRPHSVKYIHNFSLL